MWENCKVHALPTEKAASLALHTKEQKWYKQYINSITKDEFFTPHHLYFTSDEEIKEGDWTLDTFKNILIQARRRGSEVFTNNRHRYRKIVATNNLELVQRERKQVEGRMRSIASTVSFISPDFIEVFVREQGIWEVMLEKEECGWISEKTGLWKYETYEFPFVKQDRFLVHYKYKLNSQGEVIWNKLKEKIYYITEKDLIMLHEIALEVGEVGDYRQGYLDFFNRFKGCLHE